MNRRCSDWAIGPSKLVRRYGLIADKVRACASQTLTSLFEASRQIRPGLVPVLPRMADGPIVCVYDEARTFHFDVADRTQTDLLIYRRRSYDFHLEAAADAQVRLLQMSTLRTTWHLATRHYAVVELNEPAMFTLWPRLILYVCAVEFRGWVTGRRPDLVSYALENGDPPAAIAASAHMPERPVRCIYGFMLRLLTSRIDRLAFGTPGARAHYALYAPRVLEGGRSRMVAQLPEVCECVLTNPSTTGLSKPYRLLFLGSFERRKGIDTLMESWDEVLRRRRDLTLTLLGKGPMVNMVREWVSSRPSVELVIDPSRQEIHAALRAADVLVLLSRRSNSWREQVGLPILEGLAHGCEVLTTDETGLAAWLAERRHVTLSAAIGAEEVADSIATILGRASRRDEIIASLPDMHGRFVAGAWLHRPGTTSGDQGYINA